MTNNPAFARDLEAERQQIVADLRDKAEQVESAYAAADLSLADLGDLKGEYEGSLGDARQWCVDAGADPNEIDAALEMPVPQLEGWPLLNHADLLEDIEIE